MNVERRIATTLFPLEGIAELRYRFRVLKVREKMPEDNQRPIRIQRWADRLWRHELRCPVYPTSQFEAPSFLIPEENSPPPGKFIELWDVPGRTFHIDVSDQIVEVSLEEASDPEKELVCRVLERAFTDRLQSLKDRFWRVEWTLFFLQMPENESNGIDEVNAYRGLKFGVVLLEGSYPYLAIDIQTRYVGRFPLSKYSKEDREKILKSHLDLDLPIKERASFIRDNGTIKIPCRYAGETGYTIGKHEVKEFKETVLQYYKRKYPNLMLDPNDRAVFVQDKLEGESFPAPESRLFPVFTTEYEGVKRCSVKPQMTPQERMSFIKRFLEYLDYVEYVGTSIKLVKEPLIRERTVFVPPRLEFGSGEVLEPFAEVSPDPTSELFDRGVMRFGSKKIPVLYSAGPYHNEPLPSIILLYPDIIQRSTRETFLEDLGTEIKLQTKQTMNILQQRPYRTALVERMGSSLLRIATEIKSSHPGSLALIILWGRLYPPVHGELKTVLNPMRSQCVTEKTVNQICNHFNPQRAKSQLRNLALAVLTEAGTKPWVLADPLHHDLYIGIDTLFGHVYYHFLYGAGGRVIKTQVGQAIIRGRAQEAIKKPELQGRLVNAIKSSVNDGYQISSIVIHRDGRWWPSENTGLFAALRQLKEENTLPPETSCTVVEIRKTHKPIRLFTSETGETGTYFRNPLPGTYLTLDQNNAILTTTGRSGEWDIPGGRTARTILLKISAKMGVFDIKGIIEDAYRLTHLNWSAPDIEINTPVTIRWTDEALRDTLRPPAWEEDKEETEEYGHEEGENIYLEE